MFRTTVTLRRSGRYCALSLEVEGYFNELGQAKKPVLSSSARAFTMKLVGHKTWRSR
jgi:hypothetical protein